MDRKFYKALEDHFRGSSSLVLKRLSFYSFLVDSLKKKKNPKLIDIGCGRGEWLQYLKDNGLDCMGVDQDPIMVEACKKNGLNAIEHNALDLLKSLPDKSIAMISSFHVIEHLKFEDLFVFSKEAHRVLEPGGFILLETPNPQNLHVSTYTFHIDPTHVKPIPEQFLKFLLGYVGFKNLFSINVNHSHEIEDKDDVTIADIIKNVSPDYALIGINGDTEDLDFYVQLERNSKKSDLQSLMDRFDLKISHMNAETANLEKNLLELRAAIRDFREHWFVRRLIPFLDFVHRLYFRITFKSEANK